MNLAEQLRRAGDELNQASKLEWESSKKNQIDEEMERIRKELPMELWKNCRMNRCLFDVARFLMDGSWIKNAKSKSTSGIHNQDGECLEIDADLACPELLEFIEELRVLDGLFVRMVMIDDFKRRPSIECRWRGNP